SSKGALDVVKRYLQAGANPALQDKQLFTALDYAVRNGFKRIVKQLLESKDSYSQDMINKSLCIAVRQNRAKIVALLIQYEADMYVPMENRQDLLSYAVDKGFLASVEVLLKMGFKYPKSMHNRLLDIA